MRFSWHIIAPLNRNNTLILENFQQNLFFMDFQLFSHDFEIKKIQSDKFEIWKKITIKKFEKW